MKYVTNLNGIEVNFGTSVIHMDNEIRERLHREITPCSNQEFFTAYEVAHVKKYGDEWELSKENPVW